jgi:SAM-dependent methyltransferase/predicted DNA-binding transcriptional regulator AlpA
MFTTACQYLSVWSTVTGMDPGGREEITAAAIARLAGVGRAAVSNWRRRYREFPQPVGGSPGSPTFDRAEVEAWLTATGKADQLATAGQTVTGTQRIGEPERSISDLRSGDLLARAMAALLPRETVPGRGSRDDWWADTLLDSPSGPPVVLDPACGTGTALLAVADRFGDRVRLAGQEISQDYARTARLRLSENSSGTAYEIHVGDSLLDDQLVPYLDKAAAVVCEPPFDRPRWPEAELSTDPRWEFGIPASRDSELAWVQHCYAHLRPRGVAIVAVTQRMCVQASGEQIRTGLVRSGALRAVIALPPGMTSEDGTDICLWVLRRPADRRDEGPVRMIDLSRLGDAIDVPREFAAWQRLLDGADPTVSRAVPRLELLAAGTNVLPSRYVAVRAEASAGDLAGATAWLTKLYARIGEGLPSFAAPKQEVRVSYVTLAELERVGALTIKQRDAVPRVGDVLLRTQSRSPLVTPTWVDKDGFEHPVDISGIAQVLEIDAARLDAHFVATFLRSDIGALPVANTLGAVSRDDLRRCRVPRMPLAEQCRYGDAFRLLLELESALRSLADVSEKVIQQTIHGLTTGVLAPDRGVIEGETSKL